MPLQGSTLCTILPAIGLALSMAYPNAAVGQNAQTLTTYESLIRHLVPIIKGKRSASLRVAEDAPA